MSEEITQADRELFIELFAIPASRKGQILDGNQDARTEIQLLARHRRLATEPRVKVSVDPTRQNAALTPEYLALSVAQKWECLAAHGLLGTSEPWIDDMRRELRALTPAEPGVLEALKTLIYEITSLSPMEDDGSHWCKISKGSLEKARAALRAPVSA